MDDWVIEVKKRWNSISYSDWYMSLRTDEKISIFLLSALTNCCIRSAIMVLCCIFSGSTENDTVS